MLLSCERVLGARGLTGEGSLGAFTTRGLMRHNLARGPVRHLSPAACLAAAAVPLLLLGLQRRLYFSAVMTVQTIRRQRQAGSVWGNEAKRSTKSGFLRARSRPVWIIVRINRDQGSPYTRCRNPFTCLDSHCYTYTLTLQSAHVSTLDRPAERDARQNRLSQRLSYPYLQPDVERITNPPCMNGALRPHQAYSSGDHPAGEEVLAAGGGRLPPQTQAKRGVGVWGWCWGWGGPRGSLKILCTVSSTQRVWI
jgi:hypothetical protein